MKTRRRRRSSADGEATLPVQWRDDALNSSTVEEDPGEDTGRPFRRWSQWKLSRLRARRSGGLSYARPWRILQELLEFWNPTRIVDRIVKN
jgi:hypothetical protein